jgi:hypothetical protein
MPPTPAEANTFFRVTSTRPLATTSPRALHWKLDSQRSGRLLRSTAPLLFSGGSANLPKLIHPSKSFSPPLKAMKLSPSTADFCSYEFFADACIFFELFHGKSNLQFRLSALQLVAENGIRQRINPPCFDLNNCASMEYFCTQVEKRPAESFDRQR